MTNLDLYVNIYTNVYGCIKSEVVILRKTKADAEQTKVNILDAALDVFIDKTYDKATLNEIAKRAGVTRGAIYWHFENKFAILETLHNQEGEKALNRFIEINKKDKTPLQKLMALFDDFFNICLKDKRFYSIRKLLEFKISDSDELKEITRIELEITKKYYKILTSLIEEAKEIGEIRKDIDTDFMVVSFLNWSIGLQRISMQFPELYDLNSNQKIIIDNIERMIKA